MTVQEIHQLIDVRIRQKIENGSIQKDDVADALDAIVDAIAGLVGSSPFINGVAIVPANSLVWQYVLHYTGPDTWFVPKFPGDSDFYSGMACRLGDNSSTSIPNSLSFSLTEPSEFRIAVADDADHNALPDVPLPATFSGYVFYQQFAPLAKTGTITGTIE